MKLNFRLLSAKERDVVILPVLIGEDEVLRVDAIT